jgi:hypothetical protein
MKKLLTIVALATLANVGYSQDTNNPTGSFFQSVVGYFSSFNTNLNSTFGDAKGTLWAGVVSIQDAEVPLANEIGLSYRLGKGGFAAEGVIRDAGIQGGIVSAQGGFAFEIVKFDAKLAAYIHGGNNVSPIEQDDRWYCEVGLRASKALTEHTYAGISLGVQVPDNDRVLGVFAGFTF